MLILAARHGSPDCVRVLLDAGAHKDAKNNVRCWSLLCRCAFLCCFFFFLCPTL